MVIGPWLRPEGLNRELAWMFWGVLRRRALFSTQYRWVPVFPTRFSIGCGEHSRPLPIGAFLLLWDALPELRGPCTACNGPMLAYDTGGHWPGVSGIWGVCLGCAGKAFRGIGGNGALHGLIEPVLANTEFRVNEEFDHKAWQGSEAALPAVLAELGYSASDREVPRESA